MNRASRPAGSLLRKIVAAIILVPLSVVIIAFAVANRQRVTISLDPFGSGQDAVLTTPPLPLFLVLIAILIVGVLIGGFASRLRHGRWRRLARRFERDIAALHSELDSLKRPASAEPESPEPAAPPERLQLKPPGH